MMDTVNAANDILESVVINDDGTSQYVIQRLPENQQLLSTELLQHQNGLVVDFSTADFIPVNYPSEALLARELTEEDRNLAAALVAVQFSQQQKQQEAGLTVAGNALDNKILDEQQLLLNGKDQNVNNAFLQIVGTDNVYVEKQQLPKLLENRFATDFHHPQHTQLITERSEDEKKDSDIEHKENRVSRKSLPHKKRISRKLKKCQNTKKIQCNLCEQIFNSENDFAQHELLCQTTITPVHPVLFSCQICGLTFQDQLKFFEHLKNHYEPKEMNEEQETTKDNLFNSLLSLTCIECNKTFRRKKSYETHMKEYHCKDELNEFSEPEDLMAGINVVVESNETNSDNDTKTWYQEEELHQTEEDLKELEEDQHVCPICRQTFTLRAILLQHLVNCKLNDEQIDTTNNTTVIANQSVRRKTKKKNNLHCNSCDKIFTHRNSLIYHMRSHSGIRPHQCDQCGKSFFASSALKVHMRLHSGDRPYHCETCGKNFRQWGDLKYHITSLHSTEKQFQCEYCGKDFARKYSLIVHRRIHTGEKNYKCEFCGKTFRASSYLQNHRRIHTGEKPHECETCGKPFRVRSDMKRHQKTHTKRLTTMGKNARNLTKMVKNDDVQPVDEEDEDDDMDQIRKDDNELINYTNEDVVDTTIRDGNTLYVMISN